jgi:hypothetical protein
MREDKPIADEEVPFPDSLCHGCAAPPRLIRTAKATYIFCPVFKKYPPQPVVACEAFQPKDSPKEDNPRPED